MWSRITKLRSLTVDDNLRTVKLYTYFAGRERKNSSARLKWYLWSIKKKVQLIPILDERERSLAALSTCWTTTQWWTTIADKKIKMSQFIRNIKVKSWIYMFWMSRHDKSMKFNSSRWMNKYCYRRDTQEENSLSNQNQTTTYIYDGASIRNQASACVSREMKSSFVRSWDADWGGKS